MDNNKLLTNIFTKVLKINITQLNNIKFKDEKWDSINHINLILEIEKKIQIKIKNNHIDKINTFLNTKKVLNKYYKINFKI